MRAQRDGGREPMAAMMGYLFVFLGAGLGGAMRHGVNSVSMRFIGGDYPWGTLIVNTLGSLAMGLLAGAFALRHDPGQNWRLFLATGILGGFTTFSAYSLEVVLLYQRGEIAQAAIYALASIVLSISGLALGLWTLRAVM